MDRINKDIKQIQFDVISLYGRIRSISQQELIYLLGFFGIWTISFFFDSEIRFWVNNFRSDIFDHLFSLFHWYGKPFLSITTILIFYFGGLIITKPRITEIGLKLFESFAFSGILVTVLKSVFGRWRPYTEHGNFSFVFLTIGPNDHLSMPSGDVAIAVSFSIIIAGTINNKLWKLIWILFAAITSIGRIYHDQHWLSDVILAVGIALWIGSFLNNRTSNNQR